MNFTHFHRTHYIYEADNIPDHRSRRFGRSSCLLAYTWVKQAKSRDRRCSVGHGRCKTNQQQRKFVLPLYHNLLL